MAIYSCRSDTSAHTNYYVDYTATRSGNTTTLKFSLKFVLGSATGLGLGNSRDAEIYIDNTRIAKVEIKDKDTKWSYGTTHTATVTCSLTTSNILAATRQCKIKIVVGAKTTGIGSCLWTTYPVNFGLTVPASPNTAPKAPTSFSTNQTVYKPDDNIVLTWSGGSDAEGNIAKYILEESVSPYSTWTVAKEANTSSGDGSLTVKAPNLRGSSRKYRIKLLDGAGAASPYKESNVFSIKNLPFAPTALKLSATSIAPGEKSVLSFTPSTSGYTTISRYEVAAKKNGSSSWYNNTQIMFQRSASPIDIITTGWKDQETWQFFVRSVDNYGEISEWSSPSPVLSVFKPYVATPDPIESASNEINQNIIAAVRKGRYAGMNEHEVITTTKLMMQLKQLDLYRAKYLPSNRTGTGQNAWCFHGNKAQGWGTTNNSAFPSFSSVAGKLCTTKRADKTNISINTNTYPYLSFQYKLLDKPLSFLAGLYPSAEIINIKSVLTQLGVSNVDDASDPSYILINNYRFCPKTTFSNGYTSSYKNFLIYFNNFIQHSKDLYPPRFSTTLYCTDGTSYKISNANASPYGIFSANVKTLTESKTVNRILIDVTRSSSFPIANTDIQAFQVLYDYVKFDDTDVFALAPIRYNLVSATDENNMRTAVESYLGLNSSTAKWSDKKNRVKAYSDTATPSHLLNYREKLKPKIDQCGTCDLFTCSCNGVSYGVINCSMCHGTPGLGADVGVPCAQCYTTNFSRTICTCYSPTNNLDVGCKCGYASSPMCNGYTCWCNTSAKHVW